MDVSHSVLCVLYQKNNLGTVGDLLGYSPMLTPPALSLVIYNLTTLCLNGTLSCVDFMEVIIDFMEVTMGEGAPGWLSWERVRL